MTIKFTQINSPVGNLKLFAKENKLIAILWENEAYSEELIEDKSDKFLLSVENELTEYFTGKRKSFSIAINPIGTPFQEKVWQELIQIPYGKTSSYKDIAKTIGSIKSVRAVGGAIGKNPIPIVIPCHRVIGSNGTLTGFAGGLERKKTLLKVESIF